MVVMEGPEPVSLRVKQFFRFTKEETKHLFISILAVALIFAFDDKRETFNLAFWLSNFVLITIIVTFTFLVHVSAQKVAALKVGYIVEYRMWTMGLVIGLVVMLLSGGKWYVLLPGGIFIQHMAIQRLGKFRYGLNIASQGAIAAAGPVANLVVATFCLALTKQFHIIPALDPLFTLVTTINFWFLIFMLLPLPNLPGLYLFFASRLAYVFIFCTLLSYILLTKIEVYSWILSVLVGAAAWFLFYIFFEQKAA
ncbi:MAG: hypothetical protein QXK37_02815 [Candidatus Woesearchaeota archaeon]